MARPVVGIFFPQRLPLRLDTHADTPRVLQKIMATVGEVKSHRVAAKVLSSVGDIPISSRHVNRLAEEIGTEQATQRDRATADYLHHRCPPLPESTPEIAAIGLDGGRILTRETGQGAGVHEQQWKEDKVACLLSMPGKSFADDPHPEPPRCFLDAPQVEELVRDIQSHHAPRQDNELPQLAALTLGQEPIASASSAASAEAPLPAGKRVWPPQRAKNARTCVATLQDCHGFGKMVAAEAYRRGFFQAPRAALLGDGSAWIWDQQQKWFATMTPIVDFVHALTYLYVTATAVTSSVPERWQCYVGWMRACWQGRVREVVAELETRLEAYGPYPGTAKPPPTDPREVLRRTMTYLRNNQERMRYPAYRREGLPVSTSMVESLIKEINYRVKGTEKFWNRPSGAEAILQVRAAALSDDHRMAKHIDSRPGSAFRRHQTRKTTKAR